MFHRILIANRGEIAVRIIRTCREMGIETVAVYSEADREAMHVLLADRAICIGPGKSSASYLNMQNIISAVVLSGAEAVHPGFGFLSENSTFARMCEDCGIVFIGPKADTIDLLGNKSKARETMMKAGVPVIPGSEGDVQDVDAAHLEADKIGYPVMIKAAAGGGGKGMRSAASPEELERAFLAAKAEAGAAFGDDRLYMEKLVLCPRHIEFQIMADKQGNVVHFGERDCSVQRHNQKVLEEAPSPALDLKTREKMGKTAVDAAKASGYENAGTIEFLYDKSGSFYFMEMNTRIQVEHPVTEMVTGMDFIKEQIRVAAGESLSRTQKQITAAGHAIECRINAENPKKGFLPSPGLIRELILPGGPGVRVDSGIYAGYRIPPLYDSMLAKIIVHADTREEAIARMKRVLSEFYVDGIDTNIDFLYEIMEHPVFESGDYDTSFIGKYFGSYLEAKKQNRQS